MPRQCGKCTMCCLVLGVKEVDSPPNQWCKHCKSNKKKGCSIYADRPDPCKEFSCSWLDMDFIPHEMRPDKTGVVMLAGEVPSKSGKVKRPMLIMYVDPKRPKAHTSAYFRMMAMRFPGPSIAMLNAQPQAMNEVAEEMMRKGEISVD